MYLHSAVFTYPSQPAHAHISIDILDTFAVALARCRSAFVDICGAVIATKAGTANTCISCTRRCRAYASVVARNRGTFVNAYVASIALEAYVAIASVKLRHVWVDSCWLFIAYRVVAHGLASHSAISTAHDSPEYPGPQMHVVVPGARMMPEVKVDVCKQMQCCTCCQCIHRHCSQLPPAYPSKHSQV